MTDNTPALDFSGKYSQTHARQYDSKHRSGLRRRLSNWREVAMARKALQLAGEPTSVLDLPAGTGRFWGLLAEQPERKLFAADLSRHMLGVALEQHAAEMLSRVAVFRCSVFTIPSPDNAVETIFCMRLLHHIVNRADRLALLREFRRVASATVCLSVWVDGNVQARRRKRLENSRRPRAYRNRVVIPRHQLEQEFRSAGLEIAGHVDFLRFYSMWRTYILRVPPK